MFHSYWSIDSSSSSKTTALDSSPARATACAALDLVSCFHNKHLNIFTSAVLRVREDETDVIGAGGFSHVELGLLGWFSEPIRVAVKRSRLFPRERRPTTDATFNKHLAELATELRVLSHEKLRTHSNIVNILGISVNLNGPATFLGLVAEYAEIGSLRQFLINEGQAIPYTERVHLAAQLASGLAAVHSVNVAHGDVKTDNALVFKDDGGFRIKLSDFGQSILQPVADVPGNDNVIPPTGTPLLSAPEVRNGSCHFGVSFTVEDAIATDIFSFGLCTWEIIKGGLSFFDKAWLKIDSTNDDQDSMISYLNDLPQDHLCTLGMEYLHSLDHGMFNNVGIIELVLCACLLDEPHLREPMWVVLKCFATEHTRVEDMEINDEERLSTWTIHSSLQQAEVFLRGRSHLLGDMPLALRGRIFEDLEWIAESIAIAPDTRAYAALIAADFLASGLDAGKSDTEKVLKWFHRAVELGSSVATIWYDRVCYALGQSPLPYEKSAFWLEFADEISGMNDPGYLIQRLQSLNKAYASRCREDDLALVTRSLTHGQDIYEIALFNADFIDHIGPVHLAAWYAEVNTVLDILSTLGDYHLNTRSMLGFNAAHFAVAGGNRKVLQALADEGVDVKALSYHNITTLHLAIFIAAEEIDEAISFLVASGASADVVSDEIQWAGSRLVLSGTPLQWAVVTRNMPMVKALAPHSIGSLAECLGIAIQFFHLEIAKVLIVHCQIYGQVPWISREFDCLEPIRDPFAHWIAHGPDHIKAIKLTVNLCRVKKLLIHGCRSSSSHLLDCVMRASCDDDFHLAKSLVHASPVYDVFNNEIRASPLHYAFKRSGDDPRWFKVIGSLSEWYTTEELQQRCHNGNMSLFESAIEYGSIIGVYILVDERRVNVNLIPSDGKRPPWAYWAGAEKHQREMLSLLLPRGMEISITPSDTETFSTFDILIDQSWNRSWFDDFVDLFLSDKNAFEILQRALLRTLSLPLRGDVDKIKRARLDMLRALLKREMVVSHVNSPLIKGHTALQSACNMARPDVVRLLLEVGADPSMPFIRETGKDLVLIYPLQICVITGYSESRKWLLRMQDFQTGDVLSTDLPWNTVSSALEAALEVMRSHTVRGDDIFKEVDERSLVWAMLYVPEMVRTMSISADTCSEDPRTTEEYWLNEIKSLGPGLFLDKYTRERPIPKDLVEITYIPERYRLQMRQDIEEDSLDHDGPENENTVSNQELGF